jgi:hypothetical protein
LVYRCQKECWNAQEADRCLDLLNGDRIVGDRLSATGSVASAEPGRSGVQGVQGGSDASGTGNLLTVAAVKTPTPTIKTTKTPTGNSGSAGNRNDPKNATTKCNGGAYDRRACFSHKGVK